MRRFVFESSCALAAGAALIIALAGCSRRPANTEGPPPPEVTVSQPVERNVTDFVEYTGRTDAVQSVDIQARVTGYLVKMPFVEGAEVKKDDLLFEIDPRPYQAEYDQGQSEVELNEAKLKLAQADNARAKAIAALNPGAISKQDLDRYQANEEEALAAVAASKAALENYKINLEFTRVTSPIDGRVSRYFLTLGNLVNQDVTRLTTVVSEDPIYAYFDIDELTLLRILRNLMPDRQDAMRTKKIHVLMGLADETGYPHAGYVDFANNVVTPETGTITVRGVFANPPLPSGRRLLRPGMFVRIRLAIDQPHPGLLVFDAALGTDQGQKYVLVVNDQNVVEYRRVITGPLQDDGLRAISSGLKPGEWVITDGMQMVRPKMKVKVQRAAMPVLPVEVGPPTSAEAPAVQQPTTPMLNEPQATEPGSTTPNPSEPAPSAPDSTNPTTPAPTSPNEGGATEPRQPQS